MKINAPDDKQNKIIKNISQSFYSRCPDGICSALLNIRNPKWNYADEDDNLPGFSYDTADVFLQGSCWLFSIVLQKEANLQAYEIRGNNNRLIHTFCKTDFYGQNAFVDIRGIITDFNELIAPFCIFPNEKINIVSQNVDSDYKNMTDDEKLGYEFALYLYHTNKSIYS